MIDFDKIAETTIPNMKGGNGSVKAGIFQDGQTKIMRSVLGPGCSIGLHQHEKSCEIVYIIEGEAVAYLDGRKEVIKKGEVHYCPKGSSHTMKNETATPVICLNVIVDC